MAPVTVQIYLRVGLKYSGGASGGTPSHPLIRVLIIIFFRRGVKGMDVQVDRAVTLGCFWKELATVQGIGDDDDGHLRQ